jgi:EAL domain-containing protein (putative c-di-GMP-specific phosphodiesterase class I)
VHILKIDRSFTERVDNDQRAAALVEAMIVMGQALDLEIVAEGVERQEQIGALRRLGCRVAQGFLFSRPMPRDEVVALLRPGAIAEHLPLSLVGTGD